MSAPFISLQSLLLIGIGGFSGAIVRYLLGMWISQRIPNAFPFATFAINVTGCLLIGFLSKLPNFGDGRDLRYLCIIGFLGAYTTFSTFGNESLALLQKGLSLFAMIYISASLFLGLFAVWLGQAIATQMQK